MVLAFLQNINGGKKYLLTALFLVFLLSFATTLSVETVQAQGSCTCVRLGSDCVSSGASSCDSGYSPMCDRGGRGTCGGCTCELKGGGYSDGVIDFDTLEKVTLKNISLAGQPLSAPIQQALPYVFAAAGTALLVFIIYSGYRMMLSRGDPKAMAAGRQALMYGILGIVIIIVAYWIVVVIGEFFGITPFNDVFTDT